MSGGFFRGTSADQDTRFSNKQAKLLKSQKFSPELEHLVDMTKVKMDVIKPWIANRVTELLGFEDEVLINFIYGLLEKKEVNGKEVQISLTGFMEKNTVKFMKELWTLLLSAQKNVSGVPQQFLDAKEEENRKKKAEADRIANEIEKNKSKESRELEEERTKKMDEMADTSAINSALESNLKPRTLSNLSRDEEEVDKRNNGVRGRYRESQPAKRSPSSPRGSPSQSNSRSFSNPKSHSEHKSRSSSRSPKARGRSISVGRVYRSPLRSVTPHRRHSPLHSRSPSRRRSSYSRRRSRSRSHCRSPSPLRRRLRSPFRRRSPSPMRRRRSPSPLRRRRSPSPVRHRRSPSPIRRRRSPSPVRRRRSPSPVRRRRSPSPVRRRRSPSPVRRRRSPSPIRRRSPSLVHRRSLSPVRRRSPSPIRRRSPSPFRRGSFSPVQPQYRRSPPRRISPLVRHRSPISRRRSSTSSLRRSPSPYRSSSSSPIQRMSPSPIRRKSPKQHRSPMRSPSERIRTHEKQPPLARRSSSSLRSPQRDMRVRDDTLNKVSGSKSSPERSLSLSESPPRARDRVPGEDRKSFSPHQSPFRQTGKRVSRDGSFSSAQNAHYDSLETSEEREEPKFAREDVDRTSKLSQKRSIQSSAANKQKDSPISVQYKDGLAPKGLADHQVTASHATPDAMELRSKGEEIRSYKSSGRRVPPESPTTLYKDSLLGGRKHSSYPGESTDAKNRSRPNNANSNQRDSDNVQDSIGKVDHNSEIAPEDSSSEKSDKHRSEYKKRRKHKRSERKEADSDDDDSYDSELEDRKEAKRRKRKEEKKLRKEEKRRRREERRRRREERRAGKLKVKNQDDVYGSEVELTARRESHPSDDEEMQSEQKRLEIELRKKALESLKAKKGISH